MDKSEKARRAERQKMVSGLVFGLLLLSVGLLFTLDNLGVFDAGRLRDYWPVLLVAMGLPALIAPKDAGDPAWGVTLVSLGVFFQLQRLDVIDWSLWDVWPILLILAGVAILAGSLFKSRPREPEIGAIDNGGAR